MMKQRILAVMVGLAMLAVPATALAGHHDWGGHGHWRHGWARRWHHPAFHPQWQQRGFRPGWTQREPDGDQSYNRPWSNRYAPAGGYYRQGPWNREPDRDDYNNWNSSYNYKPTPYYNGYRGKTGVGLMGMVNQQTAARAFLRNQYRMEMMRGNRNAAKHTMNHIKSINREIGRENAAISLAQRRMIQAAPYGSVPYSYGNTYSSYNTPYNNYGTPYGYSSYGAGYPYGANPAYGANPLVSGIASMVGPMLGGVVP